MASEDAKSDDTKGKKTTRTGPPPEIAEYSTEWYDWWLEHPPKTWPEWLSRDGLGLTANLLKNIKSRATGLLTEEVAGKKLKGHTAQLELKAADDELEKDFGSRVKELRPRVTHGFRQKCWRAFTTHQKAMRTRPNSNLSKLSSTKPIYRHSDDQKPSEKAFSSHSPAKIEGPRHSNQSKDPLNQPTTFPKPRARSNSFPRRRALPKEVHVEGSYDEWPSWNDTPNRAPVVQKKGKRSSVAAALDNYKDDESRETALRFHLRWSFENKRRKLIVEEEQQNGTTGRTNMMPEPTSSELNEERQQHELVAVSQKMQETTDLTDEEKLILDGVAEEEEVDAETL